MAKGKKFTELCEGQMDLMEAVDGAPRSIRVNAAMTADVINGNRRVYPAGVIKSAVDEWRSHLNESANRGYATVMLGEAEHPSDKGGRANLLETVIKWNEIDFDGTRVNLVGHVLPTSKGKDILSLLENGVFPGVSVRGYGEGKSEGKGEDKIFRVTDFHIRGFDMVLEPSFENQVNLLESQNQLSLEDEMSEELLEKAQNEKAELQRKLDEAQKLIADGESAKAALEESKRVNAVNAAVEDAVKDLPFDDKLNKMFVESVKGQTFKSADEVKQFTESKRKEYGQLAAAGLLAGMGFDEKTKSITVIGDVLERETGTPEFGRVAFQLQESVSKHELRKVADIRKNESRAALWTLQLLERFDKLNRAHLINESRMFQEAEATSDLNLPYSYSRAIIAEAFPNLVAANIFDVGVMNTPDERVYFEEFVGETGYTVAITDEVETAGAEGTWYDLSHNRLVPGTVVVTSNPAGTTYVEGTDYIIDYELGKIKAISAGAIDANDVLVDYSYNAIRLGEDAEIERAKVQLSYQLVTAAADRLSDYVTNEAMKFSQATLGWDAVARTMANLIRQVKLNIDRGLIEKAVGPALGVASNSGGTWTSATDPWSLLAEYIGYSKVKVSNRYYPATFILSSETNADLMSNWDGFTRTGFPNALLDAAGFAGSIKGLPWFKSTEMRDNWILIGNRQVVMHRVFSPQTIKGPFQTFGSNGKLKAAEQYYCEEYNASINPIPQKASYVKVA